MHVWMPTIATGTGAELYARRLAKGLAERGHSVDLDIVPQRYQYVPWVAPIRCSNETEVTIANSWSAAAFAGPAPLVTIFHHVVHDPELDKHKRMMQAAFHRLFVKPMEIAALKRSTTIVAVSETTATNVRKCFGNFLIQTVRNGVDTAFFTPGEARLSHDTNRPIELLFVGKPSRRKAFDTVTRLVELLGDECRFVCIGLPPESGLALPLGEFRGRVSQWALREAYRSADFLLMPSRLEGFGYAAAEALACGLPVACLAGGAVAEIVSPPECGVSTEQDDPMLLARALREAWYDKERYNEMRANARRRAVERLNEDAWLNAMEKVLQDTASR